MQISECNPFLRAAMIQPSVLEGNEPRIAYDHRIFYLLEGSGSVILNQTAYPLREDHLLCFGMDTEYYFVGKLKVIVLNFDLTRTHAHQKEALTPVSREEYDDSLVFDRTRLEGISDLLIMKGDTHLRESLLELVDVFLSGDTYSDAQCSAMLKRILVNLLQRKENSNNERTTLTKRIHSYIRANAADISGNIDLGEHFGYHPIYLASLFKQETGKTLHSAILEEKLRLACRWLAQTDRSVEEIAFATGFSSRNHFCTAFKKHYQKTPLEYRSDV